MAARDIASFWSQERYDKPRPTGQVMYITAACHFFQDSHLIVFSRFPLFVAFAPADEGSPTHQR
jgi:hypothetical protein